MVAKQNQNSYKDGAATGYAAALNGDDKDLWLNGFEDGWTDAKDEVHLSRREDKTLYREKDQK